MLHNRFIAFFGLCGFVSAALVFSARLASASARSPAYNSIASATPANMAKALSVHSSSSDANTPDQPGAIRVPPRSTSSSAIPWSPGATLGSRPSESPILAPAQSHSLFLPMIAGQLAAPSASPQRRGLGTPSPYEYCGDLTMLQVAWFYDWSGKPPSCPAQENVPMIWGSSIPNSVGSGSDWLMVWNEPNNPGQANISPAAAATLFSTIEQKYSNKKLVVGNTYDGYGGFTPGIEWIKSFIAAYVAAYGKPPRINAIGMHCYQWTAADCIQTTQQFVDLANQIGAEVWVSEFAFFQGWNGERTIQQVGQEMQTYITYLQNEQTVTRYAWFANRIYGNESWANPPGWNSPLIDANGNLTAFAQWYK